MTILGTVWSFLGYRTIYRHHDTGRLVSKAFAKAYPDITEVERVRRFKRLAG